MDDFASASMLRLLLRAMAAHGLAPPLPLPAGAHVPLQHKQQVVSRIVQAGGLPLLLQLAQQVHHIEGEPLHRALTGARDAHDFLARWQRLERHVHASHRVWPLACGARLLVLEHGGPASAPPMAAESVAVLGVWIGALQTIGTCRLRVDIDGHLAFGEGADDGWAASPVQRWRLQWDAAPGKPLRSVATPADATSCSGPWPWPEPASALAGWLARDPAATPRLAEAAAALGMSPRTLQRRLTAAGVSFSALLGEVRVRTAAAWLARDAPSLAEIGFLCGYADQAHFTREFTRRAGLAPARYRAAASAP